MRRLAVLPLLLVLAFLPAPAEAAPRPAGATCGLAAGSEGMLNPNTYRGAVWGGPLVLRDDVDPRVYYSGYVTCTVKVNASTHAATAPGCWATGPIAPGANGVQPTPCTYVAAPGSTVWVCTSVTLGATTLYQAGNGWTTNPNSPCAPAAEVSCATGAPWCPAKHSIDVILCPLLAPFFPPSGDVGIFWDCPPYTTHAPASLAFHYAVPRAVR